MIRALKSSWWLHIPGMLAIAAMVALMAARRPWPSRAPVHFDFYWNADRWGSPWESSIFPVLAIGILLAAIWSSTVWATREDGLKRFNLTLPLVVAPLGGMMGVHFWYWWNLPQLAGAGHAPGGWWWVGTCAAIVCAASTTLEIFRKPLPAIP
jgi:hypothetical protein